MSDKGLKILPAAGPCPFCQSTRNFMLSCYDSTQKVFWIACRNCDASGPTNEMELEAVLAWNKHS